MADFLKVEEVLSELDLKEDMSAAEFGCGSALFALALSRKLKKGRVYAIDIQEEKLSALRGKLSIEKINNVSTILSDLESEGGSTLPSNSLDVVLIPNVLFQAEDKYAMIKEAERVLKSGGQLLVIDWLKAIPSHPKLSMISPDEIKKIADSLGLSLKKEFHAGDYHFVLLFTK